MPTILADTFQSSLARLSNQEQKQAKLTAYDLQTEPDRPGLQMHRIDKSRDANFWSVRVSRDLRIIVHKTGASIVLAYVGHHDDAYKWAERRVIDTHQRTGAIQIREVRELVEEIAPQPAKPRPGSKDGRAEEPVRLFESLSQDDLLSIGVPEDWIADVQSVSEDGFFELAPHLPPEAAEALLSFATDGVLHAPEPIEGDPLQHPDTMRRFRVLEGQEELQAALEAPFDKWTVFLHPSQRALVERDFSGPARVAGSAGTGKTVVALHRVARLLGSDLDAKVLLTTFSEPLARSLKAKLQLLCGEGSTLPDRASIRSFQVIATELYALASGQKPHIAQDETLRAVLVKAAEEQEVAEVSEQFLVSEWTHVIDAWQIESAESYGDVPRMGRKNRLGKRQRERLWEVFAVARKKLKEQGLMTSSDLFAATTKLYETRADKPFSHIVVDEAQDLGVAELRFLSAIAPDKTDALFLAGDLGQRIFQQPFSWKGLGVDVRGRSFTLKVNYRTSHQIRRVADRLLPESIRDVDGLANERRGTISIFDGPDPTLVMAGSEQAECDKVSAILAAALKEGFAPPEIGIFVRSQSELPRARKTAEAAGLPIRGFVDPGKGETDAALVGVMHLAKGLEFRLVILMACDEGVLPLASRIADVADDFELDEVRITEKQLFYVAATRARDRLVISAVDPGSEFIEELYEA
jgi:hypothetical protein